MKKIYIVILIGIMLMMFVACKESEGDTVTNKKIAIRWKLETAELTDESKINDVMDFFKEANYAKLEAYDGKGWIYEVTYTDDAGEVHKITVIDEYKISYKNDYYECDGIDITFLDEMSGFDRESKN